MAETAARILGGNKMKKKYVKPEILFEDFTLSTSVASCTTDSKVKVMATESCGFYDEYLKVVVVSNGVQGCAEVDQEYKGSYRVAETPGENDGVCYHVPIESYKMFNS